MATNPLVSIALCTYNGAKYLQPLLDSVLAQTYQNIEIVVVDDCSTDNTYDMLAAYARENPNIRLYKNESNLGFVKNFERALNYCTGELIALCDQDDIWLANKIELQVNALGDNVLLYHDSEFVSEDGVTLNKKMSDLFNFYRGDQPEVFLLSNCVSGHSILVKREIIKYALPLNEGLYHDWWIAYVATNHGSVDYIPECLVKYRQHEKSDTDLLWIKSDDKYRKMSSTELITRDIKWLTQCVNYTGNKNPGFVREFYELYIKRIDSYTSFKLMRFMLKNINVLFYIHKLSKAEKLRRIIRVAWGFKTKNLWYKYIKGNEKKIIKSATLE